MATATIEAPTTSLQASALVRESGRRLTNKAEPRVISTPSAKINEWVRQGDVYLIRIEKKPKGVAPTAVRQLAPGTTQGSRHCVSAEVKCFAQTETFVEHMGRRLLAGPIIVAKDRFTVSHPEHDWHDLPAGTYQVAYQMNWQQQRAVRD